MKGFIFANPEFLWLLVLVPLALLWYIYRKNKIRASLKISTLLGFKGIDSKRIKLLKPLLYGIRLLALTMLIIALARPQEQTISTKTKTMRGIDIVMAIDASPSMLARDLKPNRLEALKSVAQDFVVKRPNDRIGVVVYSGESYTKTPVTSDKKIIQKAIETINYDELENGTAIGLGLATGVNRLKSSKAKSRIIILLTDGKNNAGAIDPNMAASLASEYDIKVYTIGLGTKGRAMSPVAYDRKGNLIYEMQKVDIDEKLLTNIAETTGGLYFRATDNNSLESIYDEIDQLEKTDIEEFKYYSYKEYFRPLALVAGILVLIEVLLKYTFFRSFI